MRKINIAALLMLLTFYSGIAEARSLAAVRERGSIGLCAHPNAMPYSSRKADPPGFEIELGRALAAKLGVSLSPEWIVGQYQIRRTDCDIMLDVVANREVQGESDLKVSKPYYRSGVVLVVRSDSEVTGFPSLDAHTRVGVMVGSMTAMILGKQGVGISIFGFEDDMLEALVNGEIGAAMVNPAIAGYYNVKHPDHPVRVLGFDEAAPDLNWNAAIGMVRPDEHLREAIDQAIDSLTADGTIRQIYARYGVTIMPPSITGH